MLTVTEIRPRVYELTLAGVVEKSDIETMERALTPALEGEDRIGILLDATALEDLTADALAEDMRYEFSLITKWSKVARMAMLTDRQAFAAIFRWIDPLVPMIDMRAYQPQDRDAALAFVSDLPQERRQDSAPAVRLTDDGSNGIIAWEIDGRITRKDIDKVFAPLDRVIAAGGSVDLMLTVRSYEGFDLSLLVDGGFLKSELAAIKAVRRYAIVGAPRWMSGIIAAMSPIMPFEIRQFDATDAAAARQWLESA